MQKPTFTFVEDLFGTVTAIRSTEFKNEKVGWFNSDTCSYYTRYGVLYEADSTSMGRARWEHKVRQFWEDVLQQGEERECPRHGIQIHFLQGAGQRGKRWRCRACISEANKKQRDKKSGTIVTRARRGSRYTRENYDRIMFTSPPLED